jgi:hypothetical protein
MLSTVAKVAIVAGTTLVVLSVIDTQTRINLKKKEKNAEAFAPNSFEKDYIKRNYVSDN